MRPSLENFEGSLEIRPDIGVRAVECGSARNNDIVMVGPRGDRRDFPNGGLEPAPDAVSFDRIAELLGHRETEARAGNLLCKALHLPPPLGFDQARRHGSAHAAANGEKLGAGLECGERWNGACPPRLRSLRPAH